MSKKDREHMGKAGVTNAEAVATFDSKLEKKIQNEIANWLNLKEIFFVRSQMHKRTTVIRGLPDFVVVLPALLPLTLPRCLMFEVKTETGKCSDEQLKVHQRFEKQTGGTVYVIRSLQEAIDIVNDSALL